MTAGPRTIRCDTRGAKISWRGQNTNGAGGATAMPTAIRFRQIQTGGMGAQPTKPRSTSPMRQLTQAPA
jgi:hypothetical protein